MPERCIRISPFQINLFEKMSSYFFFLLNSTMDHHRRCGSCCVRVLCGCDLLLCFLRQKTPNSGKGSKTLYLDRTDHSWTTTTSPIPAPTGNVPSRKYQLPIISCGLHATATLWHDSVSTQVTSSLLRCAPSPVPWAG